MSFLDDLTESQRTLLVSLPYRVGLMVSQSDDAGGDDSDEAEMQALDSLITAYSQEVFGAETVQFIVSQTVARKAEWPEWSNHLDTVEGDCHRAIDILSECVDPKEVSAFKNHLIEIGESVALAFREYGESTPLLDKIKTYYIYYKGKMQASREGKRYKDWEQFLNISLDERKALRLIAHALNTTYI